MAINRSVNLVNSYFNSSFSGRLPFNCGRTECGRPSAAAPVGSAVAAIRRRQSMELVGFTDNSFRKDKLRRIKNLVNRCVGQAAHATGWGDAQTLKPSVKATELLSTLIFKVDAACRYNSTWLICCAKARQSGCASNRPQRFCWVRNHMPSDSYGKFAAPSLKNVMWLASYQVLPKPLR